MGAAGERYEDRMTEGRTIAVGDGHGRPAAPAALVRAIDPTALDMLEFLVNHIGRGRTAGACWSR